MLVEALSFCQGILDDVFNRPEVLFEKDGCPAGGSPFNEPYFAVLGNADDVTDQLCSLPRLLLAFGLNEGEDSP
ncbi:hypothetical protein BN2497_3237 [Janthinobacterium sp. CG23_2]|nr:hypothetical protein BN2497_3237 [Janthinobacterium sp. CG23_2]CUU28016.1 hypothetical protein BN3177_3237 [Janthinobacterium sp. CG23_2]